MIKKLIKKKIILSYLRTKKKNNDKMKNIIPN